MTARTPNFALQVRCFSC